MSEIGNRIRQLRTRIGYGQEDVSSNGVSVPYISRIETGDIIPSKDALIAIAERLGTTALYLETGSVLGRCPYCGRG